MAEDFNHLFNKYLPSSGNSAGSKSTEFDHLFDKYLTNDKSAVASPAATDEEILREMVPTPENRNLQPVKSINQNTQANRMWATFTNELESAKNQFGEAVTDISQNRPFSGVGKVITGALTGVNALAEPIGEEIKHQVTALTGSKEIGEKAKFFGTGAIGVAGTGKFINAARPSVQAEKRIIETIGIENLPQVIQRLESNPRLSIMDVSPAVSQQAQRLVIQPGSHQNSFIKAIEDRAKGARGVVQELYDDTMGAPVNVVKKIEELKQKARDTGATVINPIVENRGAVDVTSVVNAIDNAIGTGPVERATLKRLKAGKRPDLTASPAQQALWSEREKIRGIWPDKDQMFIDMKGEQGLHEIQKALRVKAQSLIDSSDGLQRELGYKLMKVRNDLVEAGGKDYKEALGKYKDDIDVQNNFKMGQDILKNRPDRIEDRPEFLELHLKTATKDEKEVLREGARVAVDNQIRAARNAALKGEQIPEVEFNRQKLEMLFGKKEVDELSRKLRDERDIAINTTKLIAGSETARRSMANAAVDLPEQRNNTLKAFIAPVAELAVAQSTGVQGAGVLVAGGQIGNYLTHKGRLALARKANQEYINLMLAEGEQRKQLIETLKQYLPQAKPSMLTKIRASLPVGP